MLVAAVSRKRAAITISDLRWLASTVRFDLAVCTVAVACPLVVGLVSISTVVAWLVGILVSLSGGGDACHGLSSGTLAHLGSTCITAINGRPRSRTLWSRP